MSDLIQDAKNLLEGTTPGPWVIDSSIDPDYPELQAAPRVENGILVVPVLIHDIYGEVSSVEDAELIAAAPEMAQALAEETWEYAVQFKNEESGKWYTNGFYGIGMHGQKWFASKDEAERQIERSYPVDLVEPREYRLVRRRVSPPEVISE